MGSVLSARRTASILAALGLLCSISPSVAAREVSFQASAEFTITFSHGHDLEGDVSGYAQPWGRFTGTATEHAMGVARGVGTVTMSFGAGSLTLAYESVNVSGVGFTGSWVVVDGTGAFEGATGSGDLFILFTGPGMGLVEFDGKISV